MAKKTKLQLDDFQFDDGLDMPDFDFNPPPIKDDRKPATKLATGAIKGFKDTVVSPNTIKRMVRDSLPRGYGQGIDLADQTAGTLKNLYNTTAKELKPVLNDLRRSTKRIMPSIEGVLPAKMAAKINKWADQKEHGGGLSPEQQRDAGLNATLGEIFKMGQEQDEKRTSESLAQTRMQEGMDQSRHRENLDQFGSMRNSLLQLANYQANVTAPFQRKSLEIQFRQYFVAQDAFEEQKKQNALVTASLESITKNTGLPEYAKLQTTERLKETMRNKFIDGVSDSVFSKRRAFMQNVGKKLGAGVKDKVGQWAGNLQQGLGMAETMAEMRQMNEEMGMQNQSGSEMAGGLIGGLAGDAFSKRLGQYGRKQANKLPWLVRGGNKIANFADTLPQKALKYANNYQTTPTGGKWWQKMLGGAGKMFMDAGGADAIISSMGKMDTTLQEDNLGDMMKPGIFSQRTNKAVVEIIPGLLSRLLRSVDIMRTGNQNVQLTEYDYQTNKFSDPKSISKRVKESFINDGETSRTQSDLDEMINELDTKKTLTQEQRTILGRQMLKDNMNNLDSDARRMTDADEWKGKAGPHGLHFAELMQEYFKDDVDGNKQRVFSNQYNRLGESISDSRKTMQDHVNVGNREHLEAMGLLKPGSANIDMDRLYEYYYNSTDPDAPAPTADPAYRRANKQSNWKPSKPGGRTPGPNIPPQQRYQPPPQQENRPPPPPPPSQPPPQSTQQPLRAEVDNTDVIKAINENTPRPMLETIGEILLRIEAKLHEGIDTHGGGPGSGGGPEGGRWYNKSIGGMLKAGGNFIGKGAAWSGSMAKKFGGMTMRHGRWTAGKIPGLVKGTYDKAMQVGGFLKNQAKQLNDIYIKGELIPRLTAAKLKAGEYRDSVTNKVITSYKDIKGDIIDAAGNIVMTAEELKKAYVNSTLGQKMLSTMMSIPGKLKDIATDGIDMLKKRVPQAWALGADLAGKAWGLLDAPQDIYVKGKEDPVLLKQTMIAGGYTSKVSQKVIKKPSEIDGPILDSNGDIVLTAEQLASGLLDKNGKPIRTGMAKLLGTGMDVVKWGHNKAMGAFNYLKEKGGKFLSGVKDTMSGWFNIGGGGIKNALKQVSLLEQIRDILDTRLPGRRKKMIGDKDGDGIRDNSYEDMLLRKKKEKEEKDKKEGVDSTPRKSKSLSQMISDKITGLFKRKKKKGDDEDDEEGGLDDLGGGGDGERNRNNPNGRDERRKRRMDRVRRARNSRSRWGRMKNFGSNVGSKIGGIGRGIGNVGKFGLKGLGVAGAGLGAYSAYNNIKEGNYGSAAVDAGLAAGSLAASGVGTGAIISGASAVGGMAMTAGGALLSGAGALAAGIGSVLTAPVILGALAVAAVGYGGYKMFKYITRKKISPLTTTRYAQYGFLASDEDHIQAVFGLEDVIFKGISFGKSGPEIDKTKVDMKDAMELFEVNIKDDKQVNKWLTWFKNRFKPVYFTHLTALKAVAPDKSLNDVDNLSAKDKKKYHDLSKFPEGPYSELTSPFPDAAPLIVNGEGVKSAIAVTDAYVDAEVAKNAKPGDATGAVVAGAAAGAAAGVVAANAAKAGAPGTSSAPGVPAAGEKLDPTAATAMAKQAAGIAAIGGAVDTRGTITMSAEEQMSGITNSGRIDALEAVRYRTYGLTELFADKVKSINQVEYLVKKDIVIKNGTATWSGAPDRVLRSVSAAFGIEGVNNNQAYDWMTWFNLRFLPTFLNYAGAVCRLSNKSDIDGGRIALTPQQQLDVAQIVYTTNSSQNGSKVSVWGITASPWRDFEMNTDSKSVEANLEGMRENVKNSILDEATNSKSEGTKNRSVTAVGAGTRSFWSKLFGGSEIGTDGKKIEGTERTGFLTNAVVGAARAVANVATGGVFQDSLYGGVEANHPGKGTGGDINSIPKPTGEGSYGAMKATIDAASDMVGVDRDLMATMAAIESGFQSKAKAGTSSARGLYQFLDGTWKEMLKKYGAKYGIDPSTNQTDPRANALMGAEFIKQNANAIKGSVNRKLTDTDLYLAHFLGAGGANQILKADPNAIAANILPAPARANKNLFYGENNRALTVAEFYAKINNLVRTKGKKFGLGTGKGGSEAALNTPAPGAAKAPTAAAAAPVASAAAPVAAAAVAAAAPSTRDPDFPVSDASPTGGGQSDAPMQVEGTVAKRLPKTPAGVPVDEAVASASSGFMSTRARSNIAQQDFQRESYEPALTSIGGTLTESLEVHRSIFKVLGEMKELLSSGAGAGAAAVPKQLPPVEMPKQSRPPPKAPVSMSKTL